MDKSNNEEFFWQCGLCGRVHAHKSKKNSTRNRKKRLESCSKTLREIVKAIGIHNNMDVIRDFLVQIYRTQEMYAKRGNRKPDHPSPPKWEYLITALLKMTNPKLNNNVKAKIVIRFLKIFTV